MRSIVHLIIDLSHDRVIGRFRVIAFLLLADFVLLKAKNRLLPVHVVWVDSLHLLDLLLSQGHVFFLLVGKVVDNGLGLFGLQSINKLLVPVDAGDFLGIDAVQVFWLSVLGVQTIEHHVPINVLLVLRNLLLTLEQTPTAFSDAEPFTFFDSVFAECQARLELVLEVGLGGDAELFVRGGPPILNLHG